MEKKVIITIARGFGSGGKVIAQAVADELGIPCYENRILTYASQLSGEDESLFVEADERLQGSYISNFFRKLPRLMSPLSVENGFTSNDRLFEYQKQIIENLANTESCVIVGKCADYILKDYDNCISFYINASREYCIKRIVNRMGVSNEDAGRLIAKTDKYRADYYRYYSGGREWNDLTNYDMALNSERIGHDRCIEVMKDYILHNSMVS